LVEVKKSIYAIRAKKINKMKKAKHKIQWAGSHASPHSIVAREKEKIDVTNKIFRTLEKKEKIFAKYTLYY
jgi:hypothetical protein